MPKPKTANTVGEHTEAKLQFYTKYLERYLAILLRADVIDQINIYDLFCGEGVYSDGNTGSAVRAVDAVWRTLGSAKIKKKINLHLNDLNEDKVNKLKDILKSRQSVEHKFTISFSTNEAADFLSVLSSSFDKQTRKTRNLLFIDPYGYKQIHRDKIEFLLNNGRSEIVLFLPIEQMYRFRNKTTDEEVEKSYLPLKRFIEQFNLDVSLIDSEKSFINQLSTAFTFSGKYYATSYHIKNHTGHLYGMFFFTSNLYGLQKILEVKWDLDLTLGEGFSGNQKQGDFLLVLDKKEALRTMLIEYLCSVRTNSDLYRFVLMSGFLPKHANEIFRSMIEEGILQTIDIQSQKLARKGTFKLDYRETNPSILFRLIKVSL